MPFVGVAHMILAPQEGLKNKLFNHNLLMLKGLCPDDMGRLTMCGVVWIGYHCRLVATNNTTQVTLAYAVVGGNLKATIENLEVKTPRLILCYNELHNVFFCFLVKMCFSD